MAMVSLASGWRAYPMPAEYESPTDAQFLIQLRSAGSDPSRRSKRLAGVVLEGKQYDTVASDARSAIEDRPMVAHSCTGEQMI